jgi:hypothetical protein
VGGHLQRAGRAAVPGIPGQQRGQQKQRRNRHGSYGDDLAREKEEEGRRRRRRERRKEKCACSKFPTSTTFGFAPLVKIGFWHFFTVYAVPKAIVDFHIHVLDAVDTS